MRGACRGWSKRCSLPDGRALYQVEFLDEELAKAQTQPIIILPGLNAPASKLPQKVLDWLAGQGITPAPGDTVLNLLRGLRDKLGATFNVDLPE